MKEYIDREAFIEAKRKQYCADCYRRKGMKNGKMRFCYDIGEAPCRACSVDDMLNDVEDFPATDVVEVVRCRDCDIGTCYSDDSVQCEWSNGFYADDYCPRGKRKGGDE